MSDAAERIAHDVGKYVARIAKNVPPGSPVPPALGPLLVKDLYGPPRPSARFEELAPDVDDARIERVRASFAELDRLEEGVRAGKPEACGRACALALEIEAWLRSIAQEARR